MELNVLRVNKMPILFSPIYAPNCAISNNSLTRTCNDSVLQFLSFSLYLGNYNDTLSYSRIFMPIKCLLPLCAYNKLTRTRLDYITIMDRFIKFRYNGTRTKDAPNAIVSRSKNISRKQFCQRNSFFFF